MANVDNPRTMPDERGVERVFRSKKLLSMTIPSEWAQRSGLDVGDELEWSLDDSGAIKIRKVQREEKDVWWEKPEHFDGPSKCSHINAFMCPFPDCQKALERDEEKVWIDGKPYGYIYHHHIHHFRCDGHEYDCYRKVASRTLQDYEIQTPNRKVKCTRCGQVYSYSQSGCTCRSPI